MFILAIFHLYNNAEGHITYPPLMKRKTNNMSFIYAPPEVPSKTQGQGQKWKMRELMIDHLIVQRQIYHSTGQRHVSSMNQAGITQDSGHRHRGNGRKIELCLDCI